MCLPNVWHGSENEIVPNSNRTQYACAEAATTSAGEEKGWFARIVSHMNEDHLDCTMHVGGSNPTREFSETILR